MWPNHQETGDLVTFTEEILHGKLHFLFSFISWQLQIENYILIIETNKTEEIIGQKINKEINKNKN